MFQPLTQSNLGRVAAEARLYCRPVCFVDRPHGLDGHCLRIADTMLWFSAWSLLLREGDRVLSATVPVAAMPEWIAVMSAPLAEQARRQMLGISRARAVLVMGERKIRLGDPQVMGILNYTPDSFHDGGAYQDAAAAIEAGYAMAAAGAAIIDVGGESTRPGAPLVWENDEIDRISPLISALAKASVAVSVDTRKAVVMEAALKAGAAMVNDISALRYDERATEVIAQSDCAVVLVHAPSAKSNPHDGSGYAHPLLDVYDMLEERIAHCTAHGINLERIFIDPGIGFGKGVADNLALTNGLSLFHGLGCPLLYGASRKRLIGALDGEAKHDARLGGSIALHYQAAAQGAQLLRVHDVAETRQALRIWRALRDAALT